MQNGIWGNTFYCIEMETYGWQIIITQFAVVPLYCLLLGLWQSNYLLAGTAVSFFVIHTINGIMNFAVKR